MGWERGVRRAQYTLGPTKTDLERCETCEREAEHEVHIEIRTESTERESAEFSREPYRVATCVTCGTERAIRMNDA